MSLRPRSVVARDGILAGLLILLYGFFQLMRAIEPPFEGPPSTGEMAIALSMVVVSFAPVALRRRAPRTALAWCGIAWIVSQLLASDVGTVVSMAVIAYSTAAYRTPKDALAALSVVSGLWVLALTVAMGLGEIRLLVGAAVGTVGVPGLVGTVVQSRRDRTDQLKERAATLEREREQRDLNAARDERLRIAREMHDVVAHHLTGIVVTAGAAERRAQGDPAGARQALGSIRDQGRATLSSRRHLLGTLREAGDHGDDSTHPQPTLRQLDTLVR